MEDKFYPPDMITIIQKAFSEMWKAERIVIHSEKGESRAPALVLLYLAKRRNLISGADFEAAKKDFLKMYSQFRPSKEMEIYLKQNWSRIK